MKGICSVAAVLVGGRNNKHKTIKIAVSTQKFIHGFFICKYLELPPCQCSNLEEIENRYLKDHYINCIQSVNYKS